MQSVLLDSNSPLRNPTNDDSDINFADVFGGPPRRRSMLHDVIRHSFNEAGESSYGGVEVVSRRPKWSVGSDEKPVFGDDTANRRRFTTDDFFNDIFRGNEASIESSRKQSDRDPFGSNQGSRVPSPTQPLPPKAAESYGTSLPAHFSLHAKLINAKEIPTLGSPARSFSKNRDTTPSSSPLSRSSSLSNLSIGSSPKPDSDNVPQVSGRSRHFHFSIYKWPNKGIPNVLWGGSRLKAMAKAADEEISLQPMTTITDDQSSSIEKSSGVDEEGISLQSNVPTEDDFLSEQPFSDVVEAPEANVKPLHSFTADKDHMQASDDREGKGREKNTRFSSGDSRSNKKPQGRTFRSDNAKPEKSIEVDGDGVNGKVKEFVKIFSRGNSVRKDSELLGQSFRRRAKETTQLSSDSPAMEQKTSKVSKKNMIHGATEPEVKKEPNTTHATSEDTDESFHMNFQVREITQEDVNKLEQVISDTEETKMIDAKIREWACGKDGNIRSLLSTLQYILWPDSGWKPVPLMDMIEGNAVRKSYQRALLILHPDKLQQKGASGQQKYTADKVYELLQEAWDFFNSLGPV